MALTLAGFRCKNSTRNNDFGDFCKIHSRCKFVNADGKRCGKLKQPGETCCLLHIKVKLPESPVETEPETCSICYETVGTNSGKLVLSSCNHSFCYGCIAAWIPYKFTCPMCRKITNQGDLDRCHEYLFVKGDIGICDVYYISYSKILPVHLWIPFIELIADRFTFGRMYTESDFEQIIEYMKTDPRFEMYATNEIMTSQPKVVRRYFKMDSTKNSKRVYILNLEMNDLGMMLYRSRFE